jgi:hypothetical protein
MHIAQGVRQDGQIADFFPQPAKSFLIVFLQ